MTGTRPRLSVVVASNNARTTVARCLASLAPHGDGTDVEVVVVDNSTDGTDTVLRDRFRTVRVLTAPPAALIPELWEIGILETRGDLVAITTAHCVPAPGWVPRLLDAHRARNVAVGGAVENDPSAGLVDWAIYFCRYSAYMLPFPAGTVPEIAGDNASYRRADIDACREAWRGGFWEPAVHVRLKQAGVHLRLEPDIVVHLARSFTLSGFVRNRFLHGMKFARERASRLSGRQRLLHIAVAPAIPVVLLLRIARRVVSKRRHRGKLLLALPVLVVFLVAWSAGELIGYVQGSLAGRETSPSPA